MHRATSPVPCEPTPNSAALAGRAPGLYSTPVGGSVEVRDDGSLRLPGTDLLAGSGSSLRDCLDWALQHLPVEPEDLLSMATITPARLLGDRKSDEQA